MTNEQLEMAERHYAVEYVSKITGRSTDMLYRYIRNGTIQSVSDPSDGRYKLIPESELGKIVAQPKKGARRRAVTLTLSDGRTITKILPMPRQEAETE